MRALAAVALALVCSCQRGVVTPEVASAPDPLRLSRTVEPLDYALSLSIDPSQPTFGGQVRIDVRLAEATRRVRIHGDSLKVTEARFVPKGGEAVPLQYRELTPDGSAELRAGADLPAGEGALELVWTAAFGKRVDGLYSVREGGEAYAFTQFESIAARKMFPCFDEPGFKTPFDITVRVRSSDVAIGNNPVADEKDAGNGFKTVRFARTLPLPTYLVALAVGPLEVVQGPDVPPNETRPKPLPLRGVAAKGKGKLLKYALDHTGEFVTILEKYFGIAYPWEKLDLIAVPDFGPGAMENAGAITFKEFLILLDGDKAPPDQRRAFAGVTAHELAHQWFGDLVTMNWWDDTWLNEAFATWMSYRVMQVWDPGMKAEVSLISGMQDLMNTDSLANARRIRQPIETVGDIYNAFDGITYTKGAGVIGMFETWVGAEKFRSGVHQYFERHRFGSGTTADFLASISGASGKDIAPAFRTFLDQPGVPLLRLEPACTDGRASLQVAQERFRPLGSAIVGEATWQVPFCHRSGDASPTCQLIDTARTTVPLAGKSCGSWLLPNTGGSGYYRFTLDEPTAAALVAAREQLTTTEQLSVIDSVNSAERAGRLDIPAALRLLTPFVGASDRRVATAPINLLGFLRVEAADETLRPLVERRTRELYAPVAARLEKSKRDDEANIFLRQVLSVLVNVGRDPALRAQASAVGQHVLHPETPAPPPSIFDEPTLTDLALNITMEDGDAAVFDTMVALLRSPIEPLFRVRLINAVGHARGELGARARALSLDELVKVSEVMPLLRNQFYDPETRHASWAWFQTQGDKVIARLDEKHGGGIPSLAAGLCDESSAGQVEAYFGPLIGRMPGGQRTLAATVEAVRLCTARKAAHGATSAAFRAELAGGH